MVFLVHMSHLELPGSPYFVYYSSILVMQFAIPYSLVLSLLGTSIKKKTSDLDSYIVSSSKSTIVDPDSNDLLLQAPARHVLGYELRNPIPDSHLKLHLDAYFGDPSPELDQNWIDRLRRKKTWAL